MVGRWEISAVHPGDSKGLLQGRHVAPCFFLGDSYGELSQNDRSL